jgi:two-component SAPR family response regulator
MLELLAGALPASFEVRTFQSAGDALRFLEDIRPDVIVSDILSLRIMISPLFEHLLGKK